MSKRLKFFLSHLMISFLMALLVVGLVFFIWYPAPLAQAVGVTQIFLMMLSIDVIVGPMLTLLVYKEGKKTLKIDLTVIILIQITALLYGVYNIAQGRPLWLVQNGNRFELVRNNEIMDENIKLAKAEYQQASWFKPQFVAVNSGNTVEEKNKNLFEEVESGISAALRPERYTTLDQEKQNLVVHSRDLEELKKFNDSPKIQTILKKYPKANAWLPLRATTIDMTVLINKNTGEIVKIVDLRPWH
ncbi:MAG: TfpX/TfpZ family type IV pilin accessory protein [Acinetobacter sp.]